MNSLIIASYKIFYYHWYDNDNHNYYPLISWILILNVRKAHNLNAAAFQIFLLKKKKKKLSILFSVVHFLY